jgi:hypothetical protein
MNANNRLKKYWRLFVSRWQDKCENPCPKEKQYCGCREWAAERAIWYK